MLDKYKHICFICRQTGSLATDAVPSRTEYSLACTQVSGIANRQRACLPKIWKNVLISFPLIGHSSGHLITYSCVA